MAMQTGPGASVIQLPVGARSEVELPRIRGFIPRQEAWRSNTRWGDLSGTTLAAVLERADRGEVDDWYDLCDWIIRSDAHIASLYTTRITRVMQQEWRIVPCEYGDQGLAKRAADFCTRAIDLIENWDDAQRGMLHAIGPGFSASEMVWATTREGWNVPERIEFRHGRRFRYGPQWDLRFYEKGTALGADNYGELLDPRLWIVHEHREFAGNPAAAGVMRACVWTWLFARWCEKYWIAAVEKHGAPIVYGMVNPNTAKNVRDQFLEDLQNLSAERAGVIEEGNKVVVDAAAAAAMSADAHEKFMRHAQNAMTKAWLGASDVVDQGAQGSNAAVSTRTSTTTDPRMRADSKAFANSARKSLLTWLCRFNSHVIGGTPETIPVPRMDCDGDKEQSMLAPETPPTEQLPPDEQAIVRAVMAARRVADPKAPAGGEPRRKGGRKATQQTGLSPLALALRGELGKSRD